MRGNNFCESKSTRRIVFGSALLVISAHAAAWDIAALMQGLSAHRSGRATFTETAYLAVLDKPVEASGELAFAAPDRLQKNTLKPKREMLSLQGDTLTIERRGRKQQLRLSDYPQMTVFIDSIRGTLLGDRAALERTYQLVLSGDAEMWRLALTPKGDAAKMVSVIYISGTHDRVRSIEIAQADGDRSLLQIQNDVFDVDVAP